MNQNIQEVSDEDNKFEDTDSDEADEDSVDVLTMDYSNENFQSEECCSEVKSGYSKFSIDSILGLSKVDKYVCGEDDKEDSVGIKTTAADIVKFVKPTPISASSSNI